METSASPRLSVRLGLAIKLVRTARRLTSLQLARQANLDPSYLSLIERGLRNPSISVLETLAGVLSVQLSLLMLLAEPTTSPRTLEIEAQVGRLFLDAVRAR